MEFDKIFAVVDVFTNNLNYKPYNPINPNSDRNPVYPENPLNRVQNIKSKNPLI